MSDNLTPVAEAIPREAGTAATIFSPDSLGKLMQFAETMMKGRVTVPAHLAGNAADCLAVTMLAAQWGMNPFAVAQKTFIIGGKLGYEAQLVNAVVTSLAPTRDRLHYEWFGPWENVIGKFVEKPAAKGGTYTAPAWQLADEAGCGIRVWATMKGEEEPRTLELLLSQAQVRNSTLWATDPKQQLAYLATKRWARLYCPDVILGVYTRDELESTQPEEKDITPAPVDELNAMINLPANLKALPVTPAGKDSQIQPVKTEEKASAHSHSASQRKATTSRQNTRERTPDALLADFVEAASSADTVSTLSRCYAYATQALAGQSGHLDKATDVFLVRKAELDEAEHKQTPSDQNKGS